MLIQQAAQQIGLNFDVKQRAGRRLLVELLDEAPAELSATSTRGPAPTCCSPCSSSPTATWNEIAWKNEKFDQLLVAARGETDEAKRKQMYGDMQMMIHEDCGIGIPVFINFLDAHTDKLKGLRPIPTGGSDGLRFRRACLARRLSLATHYQDVARPTN